MYRKHYTAKPEGEGAEALRDSLGRAIGTTTEVKTSAPCASEGLHGAGWLLIPAAIGFGAWAYAGFPSPSLIANSSAAKQECVDFVEKNQSKLFLDKGKVRAVSSWIKHGKIVVEIGVFNDDETSYLPRICVRGYDTIEIVSILENGSWR
jgi:hypothetical protein